MVFFADYTEHKKTDIKHIWDISKILNLQQLTNDHK